MKKISLADESFVIICRVFRRYINCELLINMINIQIANAKYNQNIYYHQVWVIWHFIQIYLNGTSLLLAEISFLFYFVLFY